MGKTIIVIGGGVMGLCSAYYLNKSGHEVIVLDKSNMDEGASYVNAGYLSPSHIIPLAAPGVMKKGIKWMFDSASPLYIKPRLDFDLIKWGLAFNRSCSPANVKKAIPVIRDIAVLSQDLYDDFKASEEFNFHYEKKGLMMLCQTEKALEEELKTAKLAREVGLEVEDMDKNDMSRLEPKAEISAIGGTYYKCDFHTTPHEFMRDIKNSLEKKSVRIIRNTEVISFVMDGSKIRSVNTSNGEFQADEVVLAAGAWSPNLTNEIGIKLLLQAGKGYRINSKRDFGISLPAILAESKIAVTPMNGFTRFAGTMEIAGINHNINKVRVDAIARGAQRYYPDIQLTEEEIADAACGLRPVTPDGLPYIGKSSHCDNLIFACGHAMMGWSMATATGKLVQECADGVQTSLDLSAFNPDRRF